jgi:hypothetical protein
MRDDVKKGPVVAESKPAAPPLDEGPPHAEGEAENGGDTAPRAEALKVVREVLRGNPRSLDDALAEIERRLGGHGEAPAPE